MYYSEKQIEQKLVSKVKDSGGIALKLVTPGNSGVPDRLILISYGKIGFVEVKAPSKKPRALQKKWHKKLRDLGFQVYVLDDVLKIDEIIESIKGDDANGICTA